MSIGKFNALILKCSLCLLRNSTLRATGLAERLFVRLDVIIS